MARAVPHSPGCASPLSEWHSGGGLPVVLAAPHGGDTLPPHLPDRTQGCHCPDAGTRELALALHEEFAQQARGLQPHLVLSRLHRRKLDPNRPRSLAAESEAARSCWDGYHQLLRTALDDAIRTHGFALLLDIHGQDHRPGVTELGYAVSALALLRDDAALDGAACTSSPNMTSTSRPLIASLKRPFGVCSADTNLFRVRLYTSQCWTSTVPSGWSRSALMKVRRRWLSTVRVVRGCSVSITVEAGGPSTPGATATNVAPPMAVSNRTEERSWFVRVDRLPKGAVLLGPGNPVVQ